VSCKAAANHERDDVALMDYCMPLNPFKEGRPPFETVFYIKTSAFILRSGLINQIVAGEDGLPSAGGYASGVSVKGRCVLFQKL
jgi:hypothetical protein